jgi:hypothetical protein
LVWQFVHLFQTSGAVVFRGGIVCVTYTTPAETHILVTLPFWNLANGVRRILEFICMRLV